MVDQIGWRSFNLTMKLWAAAILLITRLPAALAQDKPFEGIVFDKESQERIAKVSISNLNSRANSYNNLKAEFTIAAKAGDILVFSKTGYLNDTVKLGNQNSLVVYLKPTSIQLKEVSINENLDPKKQLLATKRSFSKVYGSISSKDLLTTGGNGGGAGLSIDALYNMLSFSGRNATRLRAIIDRDYHENVIDYRFNRTLVANITGLAEPKLTDFMFKYRPGYYFSTTASDYDFIRFIRTNLARYKRNPNAFALQPLKP